jgi:hypothetical protein
MELANQKLQLQIQAATLNIKSFRTICNLFSYNYKMEIQDFMDNFFKVTYLF